MSEGGRRGANITNLKRWGTEVKIRKYPIGTDGRKIRTKRYWYNNGTIENQFDLDTAPYDWTKGRLKGKYGGLRVPGSK